MWEFSLNLKSENFEIAKHIFLSLSKYIKDFDGVVTSHEENGYICILLAVKKQYKDKTQKVISNCIIETICNNFKMKFLERYLSLPEHDKIGMNAFKKALLNFDRETDKFIVKKNLDFNKDIFLESFYFFRLKTLQEKWGELVSLSNENKEYLLSSDSFIDLLKFLVDNLDIYEDEISIVKEDGGYRIYSEDKTSDKSLVTEDTIVSSIIDLSPQKINLYFNEPSKAITLIERIFEERVTINSASVQNINNVMIKFK